MRFSSCGDLMLIVVFYNYNADAEKLLNHIHQSFPEITSLLYVINNKLNDVITDLPVNHFAGKTHITERMNELEFKIHPHAFYQTNSKQALKLYTLTKEFAQIKPHEIVYDLYTGIGTIALFVAKEAKKVIPLPLQDIVLDWQKIETGTTGSNTILLTGAPKALIQNYISIFKSAQFNLLSLETEIFALIRSLLGNDRSPVMMVQIGSTTTNIFLTGYDLFFDVSEMMYLNLKNVSFLRDLEKF